MTRETRYLLNKFNRSFSGFIVAVMLMIFMAAIAGAAAASLYQQHGAGVISWGF